MEFTRLKNTAGYFAVPMVDKLAPESYKSGETVADAAYYKDGAGSWTSLAITDTFAEIGSTGEYQIDLTAGEMNHDQILIKMTATNSQDQTILISLIPVPSVDNLGADLANEAKQDIIDGNVNDIETLLNTVDGKIDVIDTNVDDIETDTADIQPRVVAIEIDTVAGGAGPWTTGSGGDATEAKQDEILVDLVDIKGTGFLKDTDSLVDLSHQLGLKGTDNIHDDLVIVDSNVDDIETLLNTVDGKIDIINTNVDDIEALLNVVDGKVDTIDTTTAAIKLKTDNLPDGVQKNTALANLPFVMVLTSDHISPATGKTVTGFVSIDGAPDISLGTSSEVGFGRYVLDLLTAPQANGDTLSFRFTAPLCDDTTFFILTDV